jgi:7,8-dihydropterin-6-yl-methyl-4-(beta-D-ribofuranosyl)aminobenzene 5'-phosphate synthase
MKLSVLIDNNTLIDRYLLGEPGVCYHLQVEGHRLLFDLGYSDAFLRNARTLGINPMTVETVVLSHGHIDHTGGLEPLAKQALEEELEGFGRGRSGRPRILAHPEVFTPRTAKGGDLSVGAGMGKAQTEALFPLQLSSDPVWISEHLLFLGEIERSFSFEGNSPIGTRHTEGGDTPDLLPDDTALAYRSAKGLVIITGCSHAGICNIIEQARRLTGEERVTDVIGGFHLLDPSREQLEGTVRYLGNLGLSALHACHCTDLPSKMALAEAAPLAEVGCGTVIEHR